MEPKVVGEKILDAYVVEELVRQDPGAALYKGRASDGAPVAVKLFPTGQQERLADAFERLSRVTHPSVARVLAHGVFADRWPCLVLDYVPGVLLLEQLQSAGPAPWEDGVILMLGVLGGLQAIHDAGCCHGGLYPGNIALVQGERRACLVDLVAADPPSDEALMYRPPEQLFHRTCDPRVDVYSAAVVLYQIVSERAPYPSESTQAMAERKRLSAPLPPPIAPAWRPTIPREVREAILGALSHESQARPATASGFGRELNTARLMARGGSHRTTDRFTVDRPDPSDGGRGPAVTPRRIEPEE